MFIRKYAMVEFVFSRGERFGKSEEEIKRAIEAESRRMMEKINKTGGYVILFDERGEQLSSLDFARMLKRLLEEGISPIIFVLGGPFGVSQELRENANRIISLSKMTFPHEIALILALEQVYRAFTIIKGESYHH